MNDINSFLNHAQIESNRRSLYFKEFIVNGNVLFILTYFKISSFNTVEWI